MIFTAGILSLLLMDELADTLAPALAGRPLTEGGVSVPSVGGGIDLGRGAGSGFSSSSRARLSMPSSEE